MSMLPAQRFTRDQMRSMYDSNVANTSIGGEVPFKPYSFDEWLGQMQDNGDGTYTTPEYGRRGDTGLLGAISGFMESPAMPLSLFGGLMGGAGAFGAGGAEGTAGDWWNGMDAGSSEWSGGLSGADGGMTGSVTEANMPTSVGGDVADHLDYGADTPYSGDPYSSGTDPNMGSGVVGDRSLPTGLQDMSGTIEQLTRAAGLPADDPSLMDKLTAYLKTPAGLATAASLGISAAGTIASLASSRTLAGAANSATGLQRDIYNQTRADLEPWRRAGGAAVTNLAGLLNLPGYEHVDFTADPGYQWRLGQGEQAINRGAAARGLWDSGRTLKALTEHGQNFASNEFSNVANRYANLAGLGQTSAANTAQAGSNYGANASNSMLAAANARASGYMGGANAISGGLANLVNFYNQSNAIPRG